MQTLTAILEKLYASRSGTHLANDPLSFCHRYSHPSDQEIVGFIAAAFAYGNVKIILRSLESIFSKMGPSPRKFIEQLQPAAALELFAPFKHRFNDGRSLRFAAGLSQYD